MTALRIPLFIVFEGIDGSGKSTQARLLHRRLCDAGIPAVSLAEPTTGEWGRQIRAVLGGDSLPPPEVQVRLFIMDRADDVEQNIYPALSTGTTVVMDRYYYSNAAYQGAGGIDYRSILEDNRARGFPAPDRVYYVDIDPELALRRVAGRGAGDRELFERGPFLEKVRAIYRDMADERFCFLDGSRDEAALADAVICDLERHFSL